MSEALTRTLADYDRELTRLDNEIAKATARRADILKACAVIAPVVEEYQQAKAAEAAATDAARAAAEAGDAETSAARNEAAKPPKADLPQGSVRAPDSKTRKVSGGGEARDVA